jgi:rhomboid domain-containing protein 1
MGSSGLLFAMKAILLTDEPAVSNLFGISIPSKWASWAELLLVYALNPSLGGLIVHVCGVVVGVAYVRRHVILQRLIGRIKV